VVQGLLPSLAMAGMDIYHMGDPLKHCPATVIICLFVIMNGINSPTITSSHNMPMFTCMFFFYLDYVPPWVIPDVQHCLACIVFLYRGRMCASVHVCSQGHDIFSWSQVLLIMTNGCVFTHRYELSCAVLSYICIISNQFMHS
jgi:hypothetical protein